jgi:hypothetical protein
MVGAPYHEHGIVSALDGCGQPAAVFIELRILTKDICRHPERRCRLHRDNAQPHRTGNCRDMT